MGGNWNEIKGKTTWGHRSAGFEQGLLGLKALRFRERGSGFQCRVDQGLSWGVVVGVRGDSPADFSEFALSSLSQDSFQFTIPSSGECTSRHHSHLDEANDGTGTAPRP